MAQWFAGELAAAGVQIISGMACGIDGIAQREALARGGKSFGILGCGTDICYPRENQDLYERLLEEGGIVSEHPEGTAPLARHFPTRNRIISALSDLVLVIEAREKSGTLITVDFALEQGKDVYALPGRINDPLSSGCNRLIHQGAGIALTPSDILEALTVSGAYHGRTDSRQNEGELAVQNKMQAEMPETVSPASPAIESPTSPAIESQTLAYRARILWEQLEERPLSVQELYERICAAEQGRSMDMIEMTNLLMELVIQGLVVQERGNRYRKRGI